MTSVGRWLAGDCDVYIGRAGKGQTGEFGNPFVLTHENDRAAVLERYKLWFLDRVNTDERFREKILALRGKKLGCFCSPRACHGDVIAQWIDSH